MSILSQKQCPNCVDGFMPFDAVPSMQFPEGAVCTVCFGSTVLPVTVANLEHEARQLASKLPAQKWARGIAVPASAVPTIKIITRLQSIEDEYYRLGGTAFPV